MYRTKALVAAVAIAMLTLPGCVSSQQTQEKIAATKEVVRSVQDYAKLACAFVPTAATVISLIDAGAGSSVGAIGSVLCSAVASAPLAGGKGVKAMVGKVRVHGTYIRSGRSI